MCVNVLVTVCTRQTAPHAPLPPATAVQRTTRQCQRCRGAPMAAFPGRRAGAAPLLPSVLPVASSLQIKRPKTAENWTAGAAPMCVCGVVLSTPTLPHCPAASWACFSAAFRYFGCVLSMCTLARCRDAAATAGAACGDASVCVEWGRSGPSVPPAARFHVFLRLFRDDLRLKICTLHATSTDTRLTVTPLCLHTALRMCGVSQSPIVATFSHALPVPHCDLHAVRCVPSACRPRRS